MTRFSVSPTRFAPRAAAAAAAGTAASIAAAARGFGSRLVDGEFPAVQFGVVQALDRILRVLIGLHLDEGEPSRAPGHLVADDVDRVDGPDGEEELFETTLIGVE